MKRTKIQEMADGWASFCLLKNPIEAWESVYSPRRVAGVEPILGGVAALIAPFAYLTERGTSAALAAEIDTLRAAAAILRRRGPGPLHDPERLEETAKRIEAEISRLEGMRRAAALAEKLLSKHGWKFDPATGKVREAAKRKGAELLPRIIQRLGVEYGTDAGGRERIRETLSPIFGDVDAGSRGPIARALENLKRGTP